MQKANALYMGQYSAANTIAMYSVLSLSLQSEDCAYCSLAPLAPLAPLAGDLAAPQVQ